MAFMIYEVVWLLYVIGIGIFFCIGIFGLFVSWPLVNKKAKVIVMILSLLILLAGIYFAFRWNVEEEEIQKIAQQLEETMKKYLAEPRK
ncbi:MAG: hypothetical protein NTY64_09130 [Deltaproteobacteria bacterium]|nr:hypothetical protein [Deltaproteobacteria bacterium]